MRLLLDESVSLACRRRLVGLGHDATHVQTEGLSGASDHDVFRRACVEGRILVTRDYHFTNPVRFPLEGAPGVVYIRKGNLTSAQEAGLMERFVKRFEQASIAGHLVTLSPDRCSVR